MRQSISILAILTFGAIGVSAQELNELCVRLNRKIADVEKRFPFSDTKTIKIVSFIHQGDPSDDYELPKIDGQVDTTKLFETVVLSQKDRGVLLDVLMNVAYDHSKKAEITVSLTMCYFPRNAILFEDAQGQIFSYIEICFECEGYRTQPESMDIGEFCDEKYALLKKFFVDRGINYVSHE